MGLYRFDGALLECLSDHGCEKTLITMLMIKSKSTAAGFVIPVSYTHLTLPTILLV